MAALRHIPQSLPTPNSCNVRVGSRLFRMATSSISLSVIFLQIHTNMGRVYHGFVALFKRFLSFFSKLQTVQDYG